MINSQGNFQVRLYTILIQQVGTTFIDQYRGYCFQKCIFYAGKKIFNNFPLSLTGFKNDKVKFKAALRKDLNTHSYFVDEFFIRKFNV
jgi:hypothetical protein